MKKLIQRLSSYISLISALPPVFKTRFIKQAGVTVLFFVGSAVLAIAFRSANYLVGILMGLFILYLAVDTVRNYNRGDIVKEQMLCIKAVHMPGSRRVYAIMREIDGKNTPENAVHHYNIPSSKKDVKVLTQNMIFNIYYRKNNPADLVAWEPIDYYGG